MTTQKKEKIAGFNPGQFPVLKEFFSGYLHEDFIDEYGSAAGRSQSISRGRQSGRVQPKRARSGQNYVKF